MAIQCLLSLIDIHPRHVSYLASQDIGQALKATMEQSMGFIDLVEQCIKCLEKISLDRPKQVLKNDLLSLTLNTMDFFDSFTQRQIL